VGSLDSPESKVLLHADSQATFARGRIFFVRDNTLQAQPFDPRTLITTGEAVGLASRVTFTWGLSPFSVIEEGPLVYSSGAEIPLHELVWFDRSGQRLSTVTEARLPDSPIYSFQLSPDRLTLAYPTSEKELTDIWLLDLARGLPTRLTFDAGGPIAPVWSPDSRSIAYASMRNGHFDIFRKAVSGGGVEELLYADGDDKYPTSWSTDGKFLLFDRFSYKKANSIWILPVTGNPGSRKPVPLAQSPSGEENGEFSPDGRWISYTSQESAGPEVCVVSFGPEGVSRSRMTQVSRSGGNFAQWRKDGKEIFYRKGRSLVAAMVTSDGGTIQFGEEHQLIGSVSILGYNVSSDGQRFLLCLRARQISMQPLTVVQNWMQILPKAAQK
jgi:hypothetical protein